MKKPKQEKAVAKLARFITDRIGDRFKESVKWKYNIPWQGINSFYHLVN